MSIFKDKILLITGGTGSFGNAVLRRFLDSDIKEIRIFSRDEKKQDDMRHSLQSPKVKFYIGNVRNKQSVDIAMSRVDYVFSAAALKQVPSCEFFHKVMGNPQPLECRKRKGERQSLSPVAVRLLRRDRHLCSAH